jgi:hypothetical protein
MADSTYWIPGACTTITYRYLVVVILVDRDKWGFADVWVIRGRANLEHNLFLWFSRQENFHAFWSKTSESHPFLRQCFPEISLHLFAVVALARVVHVEGKLARANISVVRLQTLLKTFHLNPARSLLRHRNLFWGGTCGVGSASE